MASINSSKILLKVRRDEKYTLGFLCEVESFIAIEKCRILKERPKKDWHEVLKETGSGYRHK